MNMLILLADQLRFDSLSCNGAPVCRTPAMDSVGAAGVRFANAYSPIALCTPARASLLTGRYPHNHRQLSNMGNFNGVFDDQLIGQPTLLSRLAGAGYRIGYAGKWHLPREGDGALWGVHRWHTPGDWSRPLAQQGYDFARDEVQRLEWGGAAPFAGRNTLPAEQTQEAWTADRAIEMIDAFGGGDAPFLVTASFFGPHFPYAVPEPYDTRYDPDRVARPANFDERFAGKPLIQQKELLRWNAAHLTWPDWQRVIAAYWGYCSFVDHQMGRVLAALERSGRRDDTVVVVTADHGDMLGNHRLFNKGFHMYEETHRVPLLIAGPGIERGATAAPFANLVDLAPTLLELAEAEPLADADGRSLAPLLAGRTPADWPDDVFAEFHGYETTLCSTRDDPHGELEVRLQPGYRGRAVRPALGSGGTAQPRRAAGVRARAAPHEAAPDDPHASDRRRPGSRKRLAGQLLRPVPVRPRTLTGPRRRSKRGGEPESDIRYSWLS